MSRSATAPDVTDRLDDVSLLADPLRRRIVAMLADEQLCTCHLVDATGASQPTVSHHLRTLREAGWVRSEPAGRYTYYQLEPDGLAALAAAVGELAERAGRADRRRLPCD